MNLIILFEYVKINWISNINYFTFNLKILSCFYKKKIFFCYKHPYICFSLSYLLNVDAKYNGDYILFYFIL
jgi:hypothetical protein